MKIPDETLMAFADGALSLEESLRVADAVDADPELAERVRLLADGRQIASGAFAAVLTEPVPSRLIEAASAAPPVARTANDNSWRGARFGGIGLAIGLAAGLMFAAVLPDPPTSGWLPPELAATLDGRDGGAARVTSTHRIEDGIYCRAFETPEGGGLLVGLACREDGWWRLRIAVRGGQASFRPAAGEEPLVGEMLERLGAGPALAADEAAEVARRGWR